MFNLFIIAVMLLLGIIGYNFEIEEVHIAGIVLIGGSLLYLIIAFISDLYYYSMQLLRFENVRNNLKKIDVYKKKQKELLAEFKNYLGDKYPELEKQIFDNINKSESEMHIVLKYPEIQSSKTLIMLTKNINELADDVYGLYDIIESECKWIRYYKNGKWEIIKPAIPEDIKDIVYKP
jgi:hypothetical protein